MDYEYLHEVEFFSIKSPTSRPLSELLPIFKKLRFSLHDDVVSLDRHDKFPPWQHPSIIEIEMRHADDEVFGFGNGEWDSISIKYMFAFLPYELNSIFIESVINLSNSLSLEVEHKGIPSGELSMEEHFLQCRNDLFSHTGEVPGSESLAILIQSTYPRR